MNKNSYVCLISCVEEYCSWPNIRIHKTIINEDTLFPLQQIISIVFCKVINWLLHPDLSAVFDAQLRSTASLLIEVPIICNFTERYCHVKALTPTALDGTTSDTEQQR